MFKSPHSVVQYDNWGTAGTFTLLTPVCIVSLSTSLEVPLIPLHKYSETYRDALTC